MIYSIAALNHKPQIFCYFSSVNIPVFLTCVSSNKFTRQTQGIQCRFDTADKIALIRLRGEYKAFNDYNPVVLFLQTCMTDGPPIISPFICHKPRNTPQYLPFYRCRIISYPSCIRSHIRSGKRPRHIQLHEQSHVLQSDSRL